MSEIERGIEAISRAQGTVDRSQRLELAAYQLAIVLAHDPEPDVLDLDKIANGGQLIKMQRVIPLEQRLEEELQISENHRRLEEDVLTDKERHFLPAARTIVGLLFEETEANYRRRRFSSLSASQRYERTGRI